MVMATAPLKRIRDLETITPLRQKKLEDGVSQRLRNARWYRDSAGDRWCTLVKNEDVEPTLELVRELSGLGVIHAPSQEDHNAEHAKAAGRQGVIAARDIGTGAMASSGLTSMILALDEDSLKNLGVDLSKASHAVQSQPRRRPRIIG